MTHSHGGSRLRRLREAADAVAVARANLDDSAIGDALRYSTECTACGERIGDTSTGAVDEVQPTLVGDMSDRRKLHVLTFHRMLAPRPRGFRSDFCSHGASCCSDLHGARSSGARSPSLSIALG